MSTVENDTEDTLLTFGNEISFIPVILNRDLVNMQPKGADKYSNLLPWSHAEDLTRGAINY